MRQRVLWLLAGLLLVGCAQTDTPRPTGVAELARADWRRVEAEARGAELTWFVPGSSELVNRYIDEFVAPQMRAIYGITVQRVPMSDAGAVVQDLLNERKSARPRTGRADLLWIDGATFQTAREGGALYGPWSRDLPNARLVEWSQPSIAQNAGAPVGGYEAPWGQNVLMLVFDTARVPDAPQTLAALEAWVKQHPGRFTYPQPPSPEGHAFVCQVFYELTGGHLQWQGAFDEASYAAKAGPVWDYLRGIAPYLWHEGRGYPAGAQQLEGLYARGEVDLSFSYNPGEVWRKVQDGELPRTTSLYLLEHGALASTHCLAIPFNAPHKAAALVLANWLQSAAAQAGKARVDVWGDMPVIEAQFVQEAIGAGQSVLPGESTTAADILRTRRLPEPQPELAARLDRDWARLVPQH